MHQLMVISGEGEAGDRMESGLTGFGHDVRRAGTAHAALREATRSRYDLILLDPTTDGPDLLSRLRALQPACVLVVHDPGPARPDDEVVDALDAGADDFLNGPLAAAELAARVRAHLRRGPRSGPDEAVRAVGELSIDLAAHRCLLAGQEVRLRPKEFDLLVRLAAEPGIAVTRETLMADVWQENWFGSTRTLDVHVGWLRRRLRDAAQKAKVAPVRIETVRGHGFRLEV